MPAVRAHGARRRSVGVSIAAGVAGAALLLAGCAPAVAPEDDADAAGHPAPLGEAPGAGIQLFQLPWTSVAAECEQTLGPAGFSWLLTSPPNEHITGAQWWTSYQPVSHLIESRLGTRAEFADMVQRCDDAGVDVIADAVINHMTGQDQPGTGVAGSAYEHYSYPGLYGPDDFHHCGLTGDDDIQDYSSREQVQTCELVNLADLDTASPHVQEQIVAYLDDLLSLGVAGFRIDAAKHMAADDVAAIVGELPEGTRILNEVIRGAGEPVEPEEYTATGQVFEFSYARDLVQPLRSGVWTDPELTDPRPLHVASEDAIVFVDNHDTERGEAKVTAEVPGLYLLANVLLLGDDYGTPVVYSGYTFSDRDAAAPADAAGRTLPASCPAVVENATVPAEDGARTCIQSWPAIGGMLAFREVVGDAPRLPGVEEGDAYAFERDARGVVAVNAGHAAETLTVPTGLPDGEYCDVVSGGRTALAENGCQGTTLTVDGGEVVFELPGRTAVAIHLESKR